MKTILLFILLACSCLGATQEVCEAFENQKMSAITQRINQVLGAGWRVKAIAMSRGLSEYYTNALVIFERDLPPPPKPPVDLRVEK